MFFIAQGKRSGTLVSRVEAVVPCKGKSKKALLLLPLQGVTFAFISTQGAASLALGCEEHWAFLDIIGCGSAIQAGLIAFALHDDSARTC